MENQQPQPTKSTNPVIWIILILVILVIAGYGIYVYFLGNTNKNTNTVSNVNVSTNENVNKVSNTNTVVNANTPANTNTTTNTNTNVDTSGWKTYENDTYGYSVKYPREWRIAEDYMEAFAEIRHPNNKSLIDDYVMITKLSQTEETDFINYAKGYVGIAARPWYDFGLGKSIVITPSTSTLEDYKKEIPQGTDVITIIPSNIREETLPSGKRITRLTRYEKSDNGEFTYDIALFPVTNKNYNFIDVRIETNNGDYEKETLDNLLKTVEIK